MTRKPRERNPPPRRRAGECRTRAARERARRRRAKNVEPPKPPAAKTSRSSVMGGFSIRDGAGFTRWTRAWLALVLSLWGGGPSAGDAVGAQLAALERELRAPRPEGRRSAVKRLCEL